MMWYYNHESKKDVHNVYHVKTFIIEVNMTGNMAELS